jgi:hypothetical protein
MKKYIVEKVNQVPGPGDKPLTFGSNPTEVTREGFETMIRTFLDTGNNTEEEKQKLMATAWEYLDKGKNLTIGDFILYVKN